MRRAEGGASSEGAAAVAGWYADADGLCGAIERLRSVGYTRLDALTPFPVADVSEALGEGGQLVPWIAGLSALAGVVIMVAVQWWAGAAYPLDIGGRPPLPWPAFVSSTAIVAILWAALGTFVGFLVLTGLPRLHHPLFELPGIERIWNGRFYLVVDARDPRFDPDATPALLASLGARDVALVGAERSSREAGVPGDGAAAAR
jgi:hypothetical protein